VSGPEVVGRELELAEADNFLSEADDGFAALVLQGEAGIGKTTEWREALRRAERRDASVLSCRPAAAEAKLSFAALADLLSTLGRIVAVRLGRSLPRPLLVRIARASAGNPFYALEVARLVIERGVDHLPGSELPVPDDLRMLTAARVARLPATAREALLLAAVLSALDTATVEVEALGPAEEAGIVHVGEGGRIEFAHPLFASALFGSLSVARRRGLHVRAAMIGWAPRSSVTSHTAPRAWGPSLTPRLMRERPSSWLRRAGIRNCWPTPWPRGR
jgi:AAA ATPase domain